MARRALAGLLCGTSDSYCWWGADTADAGPE